MKDWRSVHCCGLVNQSFYRIQVIHLPILLRVASLRLDVITPIPGYWICLVRENLSLTKPQQYMNHVHIDGLTHWGRDKMDAISQTTLSNAFLWMKMLEFWLKFHWSLFLRFQFQGCRPGGKPLSEPMMLCLTTHTCVTRPQWVNARLQYLQCIGNGDITVLH